MAEAILCKHCQSDLRQKTSIWPWLSEKRWGLDSKIFAGVLIAVALYTGFSFYASNTQQGKEIIQAREATERCREAVDGYSGPAAGKSIIADACRKLEEELHTRFGNAPQESR
ncbi:hypothetical protein [Pseudomonas vancouverensis]|nr:hypothetical protein [Pseudomonas vancouverensis]SDV07205.1 hypothetical protein SAMN05216558_2679 [Pseudomonas vancouverensis]